MSAVDKAAQILRERSGASCQHQAQALADAGLLRDVERDARIWDEGEYAGLRHSRTHFESNPYRKEQP